MTTKQPAVAVVVSAYNRAHLLPGLVAALRAQTLPDFEAVLVDNGSTDDTYDRLVALTADDPRFTVLRVADNRGPGRARNVGWRHATAPLVAFTDDDCAPTPDWLEQLRAAAGHHDLVQGRTEPDPSTPMTDWFDRSQTIRRFTGRYETCNLAVPRRLLLALDGFSESFPIAMGEDTDLGLRAEAMGARPGYAPDAVVHHHWWRIGFRGYLQQRKRLAEEVALVRENPAARRNLRFGFTHGVTHLVMWGLPPVTGWSLATGRAWLPGALVAGWCAHRTWTSRERPFRAPRRFAYSAVEFLGKAYESWCYAVASVRYRTLVL